MEDGKIARFKNDITLLVYVENLEGLTPIDY